MIRYIALFLLVLIASADAQTAPRGSKISSLPAATTITGNELVPLVQNGTTKKATSSQLTLGSMVLGIPSGGTGLSSVGSSGTCLQSNGLSLSYQPCGSGGGGGGGGTPGGSNGQIQYNNLGAFGGYTIGAGLSVVGGSTLVSTGTSGASPSGIAGSVQINNGNGLFAPLSTDTLYSFAAHNVIENGLSFDPRASNYGAICGGYNTFTTDGSTTTFTYTIPFVGTTATDNTGFLVFYEPTNGFGSATILSSGQFTVTGVNSGMGGTITLNSAPPAGNVLLVVHDDSAGLVAASVDAVASGGYVSVPDGCTIYGTQANGTQLAEGAQLIGQGFTPNYGFQGQGIKPVLRVIAPSGSPPAFGINITNKNQQFFEGFEITSNVPGFNSLGFLDVPVLIGANGAAGAGGGQSPGIVAQYMTFNSGSVGFGAPIGGVSNYIFAALRFNNFTANNAGIFGPLSDFVVVGNDFASNGGFGSFGNSGGWVIGPTQGAPGSAGAGRADSNRFEFNSEGIVVKSGALITLDDNQFDGNTNCGLDLNTFWAQINIVGGWFRGNANGGVNGTGVTTAGKDAHICFNGGSGSGGLHLSNVQFLTNYAEGRTAPLGSANATTPPYVLDFNQTAANNNDVIIDGGQALFGSTSSLNAAVTDFAIYRSGRPSNLQYNLDGQSTQGKIANGSLPSQARGLPANSWSAFNIYGDAGSNNNQHYPQMAGYAGQLAKNIGAGPTYFITNDFSHYDCDIVNLDIVPNAAPLVYDNPAALWLPTGGDPGFGGGFFTAHEQDTNSCRLGGLTWLSVPKKYKVFAQDSSHCTPTGTWTNSTAYTGYYGLVSNTNGDTLSCAVSTNAGPFYLWYMMRGSNGGTFTYQIDGGPTTTVATQGNNAFTFPIGTTSQTLGAVRVPVAVGTTTHTILTTVTSSTSASNTVEIMGIGTPPGVAYHGSTPTVFLAGQVNANQNAPQAAAVAAFNQDQYTQANQLFADGLAVNFVPIRNYLNDTTDYDGTSKLNISGQTHVAEAFGAVMQYTPVSLGATNPLNYGAACNTLMFGSTYNSSPNNTITITPSTGEIAVNNYIFQNSVALQNGGGDIGKVVNCDASDAGFPTNYIASVNTTTNKATLGLPFTSGPGTSRICTMGGYPSNPLDPSTAQDDTLAIQRASLASLLSGGQVYLPPNCLVHNLKLTNNTSLVGNSGAKIYTGGASNGFGLNPTYTTTPLYFSFSGFAGEADGTTGVGRNLGINISSSLNVALRNITMVCPTFPFLGSLGRSSSAVGWLSATDINPDHVRLDNVSIFTCPIGWGPPLGYNKTVSFTGSISGTTMIVASIDSTNFINYSNDSTVNDFLAIGRPVTGAGVTAGTIITAGPMKGGAGTYTVNNSQTVGSETLTSTPATMFSSGTATNSEFLSNGIGINGSISDGTFIDNIFTGNFNYGAYIGPPSGSTGSSANRFSGGRFEENGTNNGGGALALDGGGNDQLTGVQFQFNNAPALVTYNTITNIQVVGGMMQGNNKNNAQVVIGTNGTNITFSGVEAEKPNFAAGGNSAYVLSSATGATGVDYLSWSGGDARLGFNTTFENWAGNVPTHYMRNVPGLATIDNTQAGLSIGTTGLVAVGSTGARAGLHDALGQFLVTGGTAPTISACGTSPSISGSDSAFTLNMGSGALTSCVVNFGATWLTAPKVCDLQPTNATAAVVGTTGAYVSAISTTQLTITGANLTSANYGVHCY